MGREQGWWRRGALAALVVPALALADVTVPEEFDKLIQQRSRIGALGDDYFGDHIDLSSGSLEIVQTDIDLPGNNALPVRVGRRLVAGKGFYGTGHFDAMDLDIPNLHGVFASSTYYHTTGAWGGWTVATSSNADSYKRCSHFSPPLDINSVSDGYWIADEFWYGNSFYLPGSGDQELLERSTAAHVPNDGNTYPIVTKAGSAVRCLSALDSSGPGEGFEVVTPDGTVYTMKHMVGRRVETVRKPDPFNQLTAGTTAQKAPGATESSGTDVVVQPMVAVDYILRRDEVLIFPTQVRDRFGNTVTYTWSESNPWRLLQISASDGRHLDFTYSSTDADSYQILSVNDGARTWTYTPNTLTQPDGKVWSWGLTGLHNAKPYQSGVTCDGIGNPNFSKTYTGSITAPSGATALYTMNPALFGRSWVFRECTQGSDGQFYPGKEPYLIDRVAVTSKKITGPGLPASGLTWTYAYGSPNHCWSSAGGDINYPGLTLCSGSSPTTRTTTVTDPDGTMTRHTFGNRFKVNEGLLLMQEYGWNGTTALRTVSYEYADPEAAPYAAYNGRSWRNNGDYDITSLTRPQRRITTQQNGRTFVWETASDCAGAPYCFDAFARPTKTVKSSTPSP